MTTFLLDLGTYLALIVLVLWGLTQLRDEVVGHGWVSPDSRLGRMSARAAFARFQPLLRSLGVEDEDAAAVRRQRFIRSARRKGLHEKRPDQVLLLRLKPWTKQLGGQADFRGSSYYVDTMGAVHHREDYEASLAQILLTWIVRLQACDKLSEVDAFLTPKEGNPVLTYDLCQTLARDKSMLLCKGKDDPARVSAPEHGAHKLDFEGLEAFLSKNARVDRKLRVIAIDDSCTSGRTMSNAIARFNSLLAKDRSLAERIDPITDVVVLFRVLPSNGTQATTALQQAGYQLHALVALGPTEMKKLLDMPDAKVTSLADGFKRDSWACRESRAIFTQ